MAACVLIDGERVDVQHVEPADHLHTLTFERDVAARPGPHTVVLHYSLRGGSGIAGYRWLPNYFFDVRSEHHLSGGTNVSVLARGFEKGNLRTPLEQRPAVEWEVQGDETPDASTQIGDASPAARSD
jgi:hypothetical protein